MNFAAADEMSRRLVLRLFDRDPLATNRFILQRPVILRHAMTSSHEDDLSEILRHDPPPDDANWQAPSADLLLWAYRNTLFPMNDPHADTIEWFSPDPRGIIPLDPPDAFHVPRNLAREVRRHRFAIRSDTVFADVMRGCAVDRDALNWNWISDHFIAVYTELHRRGHAHCVEAWLDGELVGGLYGVHIGSAFFGESMFSRPELGGTNASKICLVHLVQWLRRQHFMLLDTQFWNQHLHQFGCVEIPAKTYLLIVRQAVEKPAAWGAFEAPGPT